MNYIGSKKSLLNFLEVSISKVVGEVKNLTFLDLFAGTGVVGEHFKKMGNKIISNDLQYYSYILNKNYIENHKILKFSLLKKELSGLDKIEYEDRKFFICKFLEKHSSDIGFIYNNYCPSGTINQEFQRLYFSDKNGKNIDGIRQKIESWRERRLLKDDEYYFLLASLIESSDKIANTASVYGALLKKIKRSAQKDLKLMPSNFFYNDIEHDVFNEDIECLIKKVEGDILYLDPPYNNRQYASNYHMLETIARYDNSDIKGKTGLREYNYQKSKFSQKQHILSSFENIIKNAKTRYIFLSYNNEGLMTKEEIKKIMGIRGKYGVFIREYNRFKSDSNREYKKNKVLEYLYYVKCRM